MIACRLINVGAFQRCLRVTDHEKGEGTDGETHRGGNRRMGGWRERSSGGIGSLLCCALCVWTHLPCVPLFSHILSFPPPFPPPPLPHTPLSSTPYNTVPQSVALPAMWALSDYAMPGVYGARGSWYMMYARGVWRLWLLLFTAVNSERGIYLAFVRTVGPHVQQLTQQQIYKQVIA